MTNPRKTRFTPHLLTALLSLIAACSLNSNCLAQERPGSVTFKDMLESMIIPDQLLPETIKINEMQIFKPKMLEELLKVKESSIRQRLEILNVQMRRMEDGVERTNMMISKIRDESFQRLKPQQNAAGTNQSFPLPQNRQVAEQLLSSALLELQKIHWDLAAEEGVLEEVIATSQPVEAQEIEKRIAKYDIKNKEIGLEYAIASLKHVEQMFTRGVASEEEVAKAKAQVQIAENELRIQASRAEIAETKTSAVMNDLVATTKTSIARLIARKKTVEQHIQLLQNAIPELAANDAKLSEADYMQKSNYNAIEQLYSHARKIEELSALLELLTSAKSEEKASPEK